MEKIQTPSVNFAHLCEAAFLSQSGKLNIIGIFKNMTTQKLPFVYPKVSCAINLNINKESQLKIQVLCKESRELVAKIEGKMTPNDPKNKKVVEVGFIGDIKNIRFEKAGQYDFEIWVDNDLLKTIPFFVHQAKKETKK